MFARKKFPVIAVFALGALSATAWGDDDETRVIKLISTCTAINNFVDVGPPGPTSGDIYVFVDELFTPDGSRKVGEVIGRCNLIDPTTGSFGCTNVSVFATGTITTEGILHNVLGVVSVFAVTGGTGRYRGATGEVSVDVGSPCGPHNVTVTLGR